MCLCDSSFFLKKEKKKKEKHLTELNHLIPQILAIPPIHRLRPGIEKDVLGILVSYKIKINLMVAGGG